MKTGIFFDLDGTLWDAVESIRDSWNIELKKQGYDIVLSYDQLKKEMGKLMEDIADSIFFDISRKDRYRLLMDCINYEMDYLKNHGGNLYPGVREILKQLNDKYFIAIISNSQQDYVKNFIDYYDFGNYISDYEEAGRSGLDKAENIRLVKERNGLDRVFYVGDIVADMESCDAAGGTFIHAAYGFGKVPADRPKIDDIRDLPELIDDCLKRCNKIDFP